MHREADDNSKAQAEAVLPVTEVRELSGQRRNTRQIRTQVAQDIVSLKNADCEQPAEIYVHATAQSRGKAKVDRRDIAGRRGEVRCRDAE